MLHLVSENGVAVEIRGEKCKACVESAWRSALRHLISLRPYSNMVTGSLQFWTGLCYHEGLQDRLCGLRYLRVKNCLYDAVEGRELPYNH